MNSENQGFTLVELSIVLVVAGLLLGGVLLGRHLLDASGRQSVITEINGFKIAIDLFQKKYKYLPGDFPDAETYWPDARNESAEQHFAASAMFDELLPIRSAHASLSPPRPYVPEAHVSKLKKFPYSGDGRLGGPSSNALRINPDEALQVWVHLSLAGLIPGSYTGEGDYYLPGENVPKSAYKNGGYSFSYLGAAGGLAGVFDGDYGNGFVYGASSDLSGNPVPVTRPIDAPVIGGDDALSIDTKADDGAPATGNIRSYTSNAASPTPSCASSEISTATYIGTATDRVCSLIFISGF